jgi:hypothetical protein
MGQARLVSADNYFGASLAVCFLNDKADLRDANLLSCFDLRLGHHGLHFGLCKCCLLSEVKEEAMGLSEAKSSTVVAGEKG